MNTQSQRNYLTLAVVALSAMIVVSLVAMSGQNSVAQKREEITGMTMNETGMTMNETGMTTNETGIGAEYAGK
jgi:hypothetical protein